MQQRFETFTVLIAKISRSIRRIKAEEMSEFHLKGPHVSCLYYLTQLGPLTAGQLCDRCEEDKAAVSRSLEYLEQNGYVTRPDKRYRSPLTLTEKGQLSRPLLHLLLCLLHCCHQNHCFLSHSLQAWLHQVS